MTEKKKTSFSDIMSKRSSSTGGNSYAEGYLLPRFRGEPDQDQVKRGITELTPEQHLIGWSKADNAYRAYGNGKNPRANDRLHRIKQNDSELYSEIVEARQDTRDEILELIEDHASEMVGIHEEYSKLCQLMLRQRNHKTLQKMRTKIIALPGLQIMKLKVYTVYHTCMVILAQKAAMKAQEKGRFTEKKQEELYSILENADKFFNKEDSYDDIYLTIDFNTNDNHTETDPVEASIANYKQVDEEYKILDEEIKLVA